MNSENAFRYRQGSTWIGCGPCATMQECASHDRCRMETSRQQQGSQLLFNCIGELPAFEDQYLRGNPMSQREIVRTSPLDAGESDGGKRD